MFIIEQRCFVFATANPTEPFRIIDRASTKELQENSCPTPLQGLKALSKKRNQDQIKLAIARPNNATVTLCGHSMNA